MNGPCRSMSYRLWSSMSSFFHLACFLEYASTFHSFLFSIVFHCIDVFILLIHALVEHLGGPFWPLWISACEHQYRGMCGVASFLLGLSWVFELLDHMVNSMF